MSTRRNEIIAAREIETHDLGLTDKWGREIQYETTLEAIGDLQASTTPRAWRVSGRQLRNGQPVGRASSPQHVYSILEARTLVRALYHRHRRYVEKRSGRQALEAIAQAEEEGATS